jgi:hypothetical protein
LGSRRLTLLMLNVAIFMARTQRTEGGMAPKPVLL